jgi:ribosomal protein L11 methyltransferase
LARQQLTLRIDAERVPAVEALLESAGAEAIVLADAGDDPVLEPDLNEMPLWPEVVVCAHFPDGVQLTALVRILRDSCGAVADFRPIDDDEWRPALRAQIPAKCFGDRLWLVSASDAIAVDPRLTTVRLHMGLAFGTGEHPTTALCLDWLAAHLERGAHLLDYGCGSGVLALAALALGAQRAWAVDNDPQALTATADNAKLNRCAERLWIGTPADLPELKVDVVIANILVGPLEQLAPRIVRTVKPGGALVLAGLLEAHEQRIRRAYEPYVEEARTMSRDGWLCFAARRTYATH